MDTRPSDVEMRPDEPPSQWLARGQVEGWLTPVDPPRRLARRVVMWLLRAALLLTVVVGLWAAAVWAGATIAGELL